MNARENERGRATIRIMGERWLATGLAPDELGPWADADGGSGPFDVTIRVVEDATAGAAAMVGAEGTERDGYRLGAEHFGADVAPGLRSAEIRVRGTVGADAAARSTMRLVAVLRCLAGGEGLALHASGVVWDGRAYVFAGPPDAGKTTAAHQAAESLGATIFADDLVLVRRQPDGVWRASGLPWEAGRPGGVEPAPLAGIARISRGEALRIERLRGARAAAAALALLPEALSNAAVLAAARLAEDASPPGQVPRGLVWRVVLPEGARAVPRLLRTMRGPSD